MLCKSTLLTAALLVATATGAYAKTYNIAITGFCDTLTLTETNGVVVGASTTSGCDASYEIGSTAKLSASVAPGGAVLVAAGDLGLAPDQWVWEFNLKTLEGQLRGTPDGTTVIGGEFPFTLTKERAKGDRSHLPKATDVLKQKAKLGLH